MRTEDFGFDLPEELIAQKPLADRTASRLLALNKETGEIEHDMFCNIKNYIKPGDCLVINNTKVIPARLYGYKEGSGGRIEFLLLKRLNKDEWEVILNPGRRAKIGAMFVFGEGELKAEIIDIVNEGNRIVRFYYDGLFENVLDRLGELPLPHYIHEKLDDKARYQTVYAKHDGSAAAPTAGLHFTNELLESIKKSGAQIATLTLHVGLGTFRPVKVEDVSTHVMHSEYYSVDKEAADTINRAKAKGGRIIAVGTTTTRTLETVADDNGFILPKSGETDIFIYPGYRFKIVDALITNFHLPKSTLIMLVSAIAGKENILNAYRQAVLEKYRFFSFGDAMILY